MKNLCSKQPGLTENQIKKEGVNFERGWERVLTSLHSYGCLFFHKKNIIFFNFCLQNYFYISYLWDCFKIREYSSNQIVHNCIVLKPKFWNFNLSTLMRFLVSHHQSYLARSKLEFLNEVNNASYHSFPKNNHFNFTFFWFNVMLCYILSIVIKKCYAISINL